MNISKWLAHLILLNQQGKASAEEQKELEQWLNSDPAHRVWFEKLRKTEYLKKNLELFRQSDPQKAWIGVKCRIVKKRPLFYRLLPYAASLIIGVAIWSFIHRQPEVLPVSALQDTAAIIHPGSSKARLILSDGTAMELSENKESAMKEGFTSDGHTIAYADTGSVAVQMHTLQIPRGGEYQLILADGTKVWLNTESELRYPNRFGNDKREVELTGEAYFEVKKESGKPFYVHIAGMYIKVTGTSFNIRSYQQEDCQTTLVEGEVSVICRDQEIEIHPGEQATRTSEGIKVSKVNAANYAEWRNKRFIFEDKLLGEVFKDLERWYDIDIIINDEKIRNLHFTGNLPKYESIDKVLEIVELATCTKFTIKERSVIARSE